METVTLPRFLNPRLLSSHFHIEPGSTVVDYGAGQGVYVPYLAKKVGTSGKVVACEVQRPLVDTIARVAKEHGHSNVEVVWCDAASPAGTRLSDETADFVVIINTLYQIDDLEAAVAEVHRTLRPKGIVYVVDWIDSFGGIGPAADMVRPRDMTIDLFEAQYFLYEREYPAGSYHYGVAFRKL
ncbi:MAG: methyltransferase domain-containing protein [Candidatus Pacebacteria bacterium]|jgi:ubiquinone/menaquinone biosynthesis C-methylase UbiE|nr:methyltransferase domain-containing protein [Candidatus Paceibacterota bacterium]